MVKLPIAVWQIVDGTDVPLALDALVDRFEVVPAALLADRLARGRCDVAVLPSLRTDIAASLTDVARVWLDSAPFGEVRIAAKCSPHEITAALTLALNLAATRRMRRTERDARFAPIRTQAPELQDFALHFQPQWSIDGERLIGTEALLRWHGLDVPGLRAESLIAAAESRGEMARVGDWVVERAVWQCAAWADVWPRRARMAINVSAAQLDDVDLAARVDRLLLAHRAAAERFELELSCEAIASLTSRQRAVASDLVALGVAFAIDRLGATLVSSDVLDRFPARTWKLDRSLVAGAADAAVARLISELTTLARSREIRTIAVGVEDAREQRRLAELGCDALQGYLLAEPLPPEECRALLAAHGERRRANGERLVERHAKHG